MIQECVPRVEASNNASHINELHRMNPNVYINIMVYFPQNALSFGSLALG